MISGIVCRSQLRHFSLLDFFASFSPLFSSCILVVVVGGCSFIYCLTKISIQAKRTISHVFYLFIIPSPFLVHCPYKGHINRAESILTWLKPY